MFLLAVASLHSPPEYTSGKDRQFLADACFLRVLHQQLQIVPGRIYRTFRIAEAVLFNDPTHL